MRQKKKKKTERDFFYNFHILSLSLSGILESGFSLAPYGNRQYLTYESNIPYSLRFMIDRNVSGGSWIELPPGHYKIDHSFSGNSRCQLEVDFAYDEFISHEAEGEWSKMAPFRVLSFGKMILSGEIGRKRERERERSKIKEQKKKKQTVSFLFFSSSH